MARKHWRTGVTEVRGSLSVRAYMRTAQRYVPDIGAADVVRAGSGVRAQAVERDGSPRRRLPHHPQRRRDQRPQRAVAAPPPRAWPSRSTSSTRSRGPADAHVRPSGTRSSAGCGGGAGGVAQHELGRQDHAGLVVRGPGLRGEQELDRGPADVDVRAAERGQAGACTGRPRRCRRSPTTLTSSGTRRPRWASRCITPIASRSLCATTAVAPALTARVGRGPALAHLGRERTDPSRADPGLLRGSRCRAAHRVAAIQELRGPAR